MKIVRGLSLVAVAVVFAACPAGAFAACEPAAVAADDAPADGTPEGVEPGPASAPEITRVTGAIDAACVISFDAAILLKLGRLEPLAAPEALFYDLDIDNNPTTGGPNPRGAEFFVVAAGHAGPASSAMLQRWDGSGFTWVRDLPGTGGVGFSLSAGSLGLVAPTTVAVRVRSKFIGGGYLRYDWVPDESLQSLLLPVRGVIPSAPEIPSAPQIPASTEPPSTEPPSTEPPRTTVGPAATTCVIPKTKGRRAALAVTSMRRAGCPTRIVRRSSRTVRRGRVITTTPRAGVRTSATVTVIVSSGKPKSKPRR